MSNAILAWQNAITTAALAASVGSPAGLDVGQLQNDQGSPATAWQASSTSAQLIINTGNVSAVWRAFVLARTNLTPTATVRWRVGATTDFHPAAYDSGIVAAAVASGYGQSVVVAPGDVVGQYAQVIIDDPTNPDGFVSVALAYAGPAFSPSIGMSWDSTYGRDDTTVETVTRGGQEFPVLQFVRRRWDIALDGVRQSEVWSQVMELDRVSRLGGNVLFMPDYTSPDRIHEAVFGRCKASADLAFPYQGADARSWKATITERL